MYRLNISVYASNERFTLVSKGKKSVFALSELGWCLRSWERLVFVFFTLKLFPREKEMIGKCLPVLKNSVIFLFWFVCFF